MKRKCSYYGIVFCLVGVYLKYFELFKNVDWKVKLRIIKVVINVVDVWCYCRKYVNGFLVFFISFDIWEKINWKWKVFMFYSVIVGNLINKMCINFVELFLILNVNYLR